MARSSLQYKGRQVVSCQMAGAGWSRVFDELHTVISDSHRQIGIANEELVQYIIEKIETGLRGLNYSSSYTQR